MSLLQHLKYHSREEFPMEAYPALSDHMYSLASRLQDSQPVRGVVGIVGLYPARPVKRPPTSASFFTFTTSRTAYAALRDVEDIFADFYLRSGILPHISPLPKRYFDEPTALSQSLLTTFAKQGALLYGAEE